MVRVCTSGVYQPQTAGSLTAVVEGLSSYLIILRILLVNILAFDFF